MKHAREAPRVLAGVHDDVGALCICAWDMSIEHLHMRIMGEKAADGGCVVGM